MTRVHELIRPALPLTDVEIDATDDALDRPDDSLDPDEAEATPRPVAAAATEGSSRPALEMTEGHRWRGPCSGSQAQAQAPRLPALDQGVGPSHRGVVPR